MLSSLRSRLTLSFALVFMGLGIALWLAATLLLRAQAERETETLLQNATAQLSQEWKEPKDALEELREDGRFSRVAVTVFGAQGKVLGTNRRNVVPWPRKPDTNDGWRVRVAQVGEFTLVLGVDWSETELQLRRQAQLLAALSLVLSVLASILARLVIGRTLRPIGALAAQANEADEGDREVLLSPTSQDAEVRQLVTTLNALLVRQRESARSREEFAAAASHELRTPLTVLLGTIEVTLSRPRATSEYQEALGHLQVEVKRMARLTESLLLLSRLGESDLEKSLETVNLTAVCEEALMSLLPLREERRLTIELELSPQVEIESSYTALAVLVRNLLDNAHRYAPPGTTIQVTLQHAPTELTIINVAEPMGSGISTQSRGAGLGLTLCHRIAKAYGWVLEIHRQDQSFQAKVRW
ncbi:histidine kinase dimerization/phospho-acceptor domain-containing protein [Armatimonas rosea]|uniref:histidine kinase n=1 Tax=Armatimonas rosea TaxID=685828 RepID=A0A7W9WA95_ARMRO|nr:signal transduction histidine kinase [Armatimonas rosea]